jgi:ankyrin repeat protein
MTDRMLGTVFLVACVTATACGLRQQPLIEAAHAGDAALVASLLSQGEDPNVRGNDDWTALTIAAREGHTVVARVLLDGGADIDQAEGGGNTALFWAAFGGHRGVVELLLERGAAREPGCTTCVGPITIAEDRGHSDVAELIRSWESP